MKIAGLMLKGYFKNALFFTVILIKDSSKYSRFNP
jgi:hypothetical protein